MFICDKCEGVTFPQTPQGKKDWLAHIGAHKEGKAVARPSEPTKRSMSAAEIKAEKKEEVKKKPQKITLTYKWEGACKKCGNYVETLTIDAGQKEGETVAVAFCSVCKKQLAYRPVKKL